MKIAKYALLALLACHGASAAEQTAARGADAAVSDASLRELIEVSQSRKILDSSMAQVDAMMQQSMQQATQGQELTPKQQEILSKMQGKVIALLKSEMTWESMEPIFLDVYRKTFTQGEVDGMLSFYRSPAGQAVIAKMPQVMQHTMQAMQGRMGQMMPKLQALQEETFAELRASEGKSGETGSGKASSGEGKATEATPVTGAK
ncbi:DUF2059 domain-containing protein [Lysobacter fragariae]